MLKSISLLSVYTLSALADRASLDCPLRQIAIDYGQMLQPFRPKYVFQELADALNGAQEAVNCSVAPAAMISPLVNENNGLRVLPFALPTSADASTIIFADATISSSQALLADGSEAKPYPSIARALAHVRSTRSGKTSLTSEDSAVIVLRKGSFFLGSAAEGASTLNLSPSDSFLTFQAYPGEDVIISGGTALNGLNWNTQTPPTRSLYEYRSGSLGNGFDAAAAQSMTVAQAQAACSAMPICAGFTYNDPSPSPSGAVMVNFKYEIFWSNQGGHSTYVRNIGYEPGAANLYSADLSSFDLPAEISSLRVNGLRAVRARYPNVKSVEQVDGMQIVANGWTKQPFNKSAFYTFSPATPLRNDSTDNFFQTFRIGVGGPCASRFTPQASYWCSEDPPSQGGGPGPYSAPVGMTISNASTSLPHSSTYGPLAGVTALIHSWRAGRWFSWVFKSESATYDQSSGQTVFDFSVTVGGNQGSRGGDSGQEFFIENVAEELDAPGEFFYDSTTKMLYLWYNATGSTPPPTSNDAIVAPMLTVLINATGTQANPVTDVGFLGITFRDAAPNYLGPHGTPSGGDWAVERSAALFFEGTVGALLKGCLFTYLDANAVFFSGFNRGANVTMNEFLSIGETAISQWGYTDGSPVPGMGFDATAGNQPRGTSITYNVVHEVGLYTKQNSAYFQSESFLNVIEGNIFYNGPRAGVNFDDGLGGGSILTRNVLANFCRESSDHASFNSWNRQVYIYDDANGNPTVQKMNDTISYNWILANYQSSMSVDNDDGSSFYYTHDNVLISASSGAAYGGNSLKSDFGGHSNFHINNVDLFWSRGFGICSQLDGYADAYVGNYLYISGDGPYGDGQSCNGPGRTIVGGNTIWSPTGAITECGMTLQQWQAKDPSNDPGTVATPYPTDDAVLAQVRKTLMMSA